MNKLISDLKVVGVSDLLLKDIMSKYEVRELIVGSIDIVQSMLLNSL